MSAEWAVPLMPRLPSPHPFTAVAGEERPQHKNINVGCKSSPGSLESLFCEEQYNNVRFTYLHQRESRS